MSHSHTIWYPSETEKVYRDLINDRIDNLIENLYTYDPYTITLEEYKASIEMLAYTTTELLAKLCAGGFRWISSDKARFLSPTVDLVTIIRNRVLADRENLGDYFGSVVAGVWGFLAVSDDTNNYIEAQHLKKDQVRYLLEAAQKALYFLQADERIPGFTDLALSDDVVLDGYRNCESPIESILYMQLVMDDLRPPTLCNQWHIKDYRVDFAIPSFNIVIECDSKKYHDTILDTLRDKDLHEMGWTVIRFPSDKIMKNPRKCSDFIHDIYPWKRSRDQQ
jgi:very-short-patch-repair endonuclease